MPGIRLTAIALSVSLARPLIADLSFTDATVEAGLDVIHAFDGSAGVAQAMASGGAIGDFNNDGWQDIYFIAGGLEHDRLFLNNHDGTTLVFDDLQPNQTLIIETPPCRADSASPLGLLDLADILLYVTAFAQGSRAADLVEPLGVVDISDLIEFVHQFSAGCP